uniref:Uncharacterized protein n=1 Tax=Macrostomum lignano TaxID=282301 RepID=A0A1I8F9W0_9PLAT
MKLWRYGNNGLPADFLQFRSPATCADEFVHRRFGIAFRSIASLSLPINAAAGLSTGAIAAESLPRLWHLQTVGPRALQNHFITFASVVRHAGAAPSFASRRCLVGAGVSGRHADAVGHSHDRRMNDSTRQLASGELAAANRTSVASWQPQFVGSRDVLPWPPSPLPPLPIAAADVDDAEPADDGRPRCRS